MAAAEAEEAVSGRVAVAPDDTSCCQAAAAAAAAAGAGSTHTAPAAARASAARPGIGSA